MSLIVDIHVHSRFSRATSKDLNLPEMYYWAKLKGITVLGTGDFTHPKWYEEMREQLEQVEGGLYVLKDEWKAEMDQQLPGTVKDKEMFFVPTVEISNIYKRHDQVRRLHNVVVAPDLETVAKINVKLDRIGNLHSDGRPILGLDSEDLLKLVMEVNVKCLFIPAHIWTPWFAMFGSKSGFDSVEEAFGDSRKYIAAMETGLSADPKMCRSVADLDEYTLVSNSDAHSCKKLGREANLLDCKASYEEIGGAIKTGDERFVGTVEFYPEEGKYHADGHRECGVKLTPEETEKVDGICPVCGHGLTVGVLNRVRKLAEKHGNKVENGSAVAGAMAEKKWKMENGAIETGQIPDSNPSATFGLSRHASGMTTVERDDRTRDKEVKYIVPLPEILSEIEGKAVNTKTVQGKYLEVVGKLGSDFELLLEMPISQIKKAGFDKLAVATGKMRSGNIVVDPGYDGVFGVVKVFGEKELEEIENAGKEQMGLF